MQEFHLQSLTFECICKGVFGHSCKNEMLFTSWLTGVCSCAIMHEAIYCIHRDKPFAIVSQSFPYDHLRL